MTKQGQLSDIDESDDETDVEDGLARIAEDANTDIDDVRDRYETQREYGVRRDEALRTVSRAGGATSKSYSGDEDERTHIDNLERDGWATIECYVVGVDYDTPDELQKVHLADESGLITGLAWEGADIPTLEVGQSYRLRDIVAEADEYTAEEYDIKRLVAKMNSQTRAEEIEDVGVLGPHEPADARDEQGGEAE